MHSMCCNLNEPKNSSHIIIPSLCITWSCNAYEQCIPWNILKGYILASLEKKKENKANESRDIDDGTPKPRLKQQLPAAPPTIHLPHPSYPYPFSPCAALCPCQRNADSGTLCVFDYHARLHAKQRNFRHACRRSTAQATTHRQPQRAAKTRSRGRWSGVVDWAPFDPGVALAYKKNRTKSHLTGVVSGHHANISHDANNWRGLPQRLPLSWEKQKL